jgi:hypothetical protein
MVLETNILLGAFTSHDQHSDMRMDIDNMSYEELLALGDRIGSVSTALSEEQFVKCLRRSIYIPVATKANAQVVDDIKCSICQVSCHHLSIKCCVAPFLGSLLLLMHSERLKVKLKTESTLPLSYILMK